MEEIIFDATHTYRHEQFIQILMHFNVTLTTSYVVLQMLQICYLI